MIQLVIHRPSQAFCLKAGEYVKMMNADVLLRISLLMMFS